MLRNSSLAELGLINSPETLDLVATNVYGFQKIIQIDKESDAFKITAT
jgi:hypothetical protein